MKTYRVHLNTGASLSVTVQAEDEDAALEAAYEKSGEQYLCAQCTGWGMEWGLDLGEWEADTEDDAVTEVEA